MKSMIAGLSVAILLISSLGALALPTDIERSTDPSAVWYADWSRDADHDEIDDLLEDGASPVDVFVDYGRHVTDGDLEALEGLGERTYVDPYIDVVALSGVQGSDLLTLTKLPGVVMVEKQVPLVPMLDVSVPGIRGNVSSVYSVGARNLGYNGTGVTVAIFDTGVDDSTHLSLDDLDDNAATSDPKFLAGYDATATVFKEVNPEDTEGHGTHVAGIAIGTGGPDKQYIGVAPGAKGVDIRVLDSVGPGNPSEFLQGLTWCRTNRELYNIKVLSMSLGTTGTSDGNDTLSRAVNDAVRRDGFIVVAAVGNDGPSNNGIPAPAAADEAIAVGSYDDKGTIQRVDDVLADSSNRGPRASDGDADLIDDLKPDVSAPGVNIMSALLPTQNGWVSRSGTSQATPHVAGTAALMIQANPDLSPQDVKRIIKDTAQQRGASYNTALDPKYNPGYGWGLLDAYGAVKRAEDLKKGSTLVGPANIQSGTSASITAKFKFTRTEFQSTHDNMTVNISIPRVWGKPSNIAVSSSEGVAFSSGSTEPVEGLQNWTFRAWANYSGLVNAPTTLEPNVGFTTFAPAQTGTYMLGMVPSLNAANGKQKITSVQVTQGSGGKPDLYLSKDDITFSTDTPIAGQIVSVSAIIHNGGTLGTNVNITFSDGPPQTGFVFGIDQVSVPAGGVDTSQALWLATPGTHTIFVTADFRNQVNETNEKNNQANRSVTIIGLNSPPTASLSAFPANAAIYESVRFDGANSTDIDGLVVLYNFNFGDGNSSGWVPSPNITHAYTSEGIYIASLTVQDNGGARSSNNPEVLINVQPTTTKTRTMYVSEAYHLLFTEPEGSSVNRVNLPNGWTSITPGSPFGNVENKEVGTWNSNEFQTNMSINGPLTYHIWVNNTGGTGIDVTNFTFHLKLNDVTISSLVYTGLTAIMPAQGIEIIATTSVPDTKIAKGSILSLNIWCAINGENGVLEFGTKQKDSGIDIAFTSFPGIPPIVEAGQNVSTRVNTTVSFEPTATDEDGQIIKWEWDFDGDGTYDYSSSKTGTTTHDYPQAGTFNATLRVTDSNGDWATDSLTVTVLPPNRPPVIKDPNPTESVVNIDAGSFKVFSVSVSDPDGDPLTIKWYVDNKKRSESGASFNYSPMVEEVGTHNVKVAVSDGLASANHTWSARVQAVNRPPVIDAVSPALKSVTMTSTETKMFEVLASDPDGDTITYKWTVDGVASGTQDYLQYFADSESVGTHIVKVEVSDGEFKATNDWSLEVVSSNQKPVIRSMVPEDGQTFKTTVQITFEVDVYDPDSDPLTYKWTSSIDGQIGTAKSLTMSLSNGTHTITIKVEDGRGGSTTKSVSIIVEKPKKKETNPLAVDTMTCMLVLVLAIVIGLIVVYMMMSSKRHDLEVERAAAVQRAQVAQAARPKKAQGAKARPVTAKPKAPIKPVRKETLIEKAIDEELLEMGDNVKITADHEEPAQPKPRPIKKIAKKVVKKPAGPEERIDEE